VPVFVDCLGVFFRKKKLNPIKRYCPLSHMFRPEKQICMGIGSPFMHFFQIFALAFMSDYHAFYYSKNGKNEKALRAFFIHFLA
jgi:hypothetical protein